MASFVWIIPSTHIGTPIFTGFFNKFQVLGQSWHYCRLTGGAWAVVDPRCKLVVGECWEVTPGSSSAAELSAVRALETKTCSAGSPKARRSAERRRWQGLRVGLWWIELCVFFSHASLDLLSSSKDHVLSAADSLVFLFHVCFFPSSAHCGSTCSFLGSPCCYSLRKGNVSVQSHVLPTGS